MDVRQTGAFYVVFISATRQLMLCKDEERFSEFLAALQAPNCKRLDVSFLTHAWSQDASLVRKLHAAVPSLRTLCIAGMNATVVQFLSILGLYPAPEKISLGGQLDRFPSSGAEEEGVADLLISLPLLEDLEITDSVGGQRPNYCRG
ncbi:hypothetical protein EV715DRAFT_268481 [Schizophyllum commune]